MFSVAKIDANDYNQLPWAFVENYNTQILQRVLITDFNDMKQGRDEPVQEFFARIGDTLYNYKMKKTNKDIRGPVIQIPEDRRENLAEYMALPLALQQEVHKHQYEQFNTNNISYLNLQFFIPWLHPNILLEVIKSGTLDLYEAFKTAHACKTSLQNKKIPAANSAKVN